MYRKSDLSDVRSQVFGPAVLRGEHDLFIIEIRQYAAEFFCPVHGLICADINFFSLCENKIAGPPDHSAKSRRGDDHRIRIAYKILFVENGIEPLAQQFAVVDRDAAFLVDINQKGVPVSFLHVFRVNRKKSERFRLRNKEIPCFLFDRLFPAHPEILLTACNAGTKAARSFIHETRAGTAHSHYHSICYDGSIARSNPYCNRENTRKTA